jgi:Immunoglobulin-like domain of bacterial spore germination
MSRSTDELETRVAAALRAEADEVLPEDGSLSVIRRRGHAARQRRRLAAAGVGAAAVVALAVAVPLLRDDDGAQVSTEGVTSTTGTTAPSDTTAPPVVEPPETGTPSELDQAMWPDPAGGELFADPVDAARSFVTAITGVTDPPLSDFSAVPPDGGVVALYRVAEDGSPMDRIATEISLRRLDGEHWFVTLATSTDVRIDSPAAGAEVASPLAVTGAGRGFEGTIVVRLLDRTTAAAQLGENNAIAGAGEALEPFTIRLPFEGATAPIGILVASDTSGFDLGVPGFAAVPVRLDAASGGPPGTTVPPSDPGYEFPQAPLWPFRTQAEADQWLATADQGHSPWHADAAATAQFFTMNYLGFAELDQVTSEDVRADEAWIGVGYRRDDGRLATSAVIHLRRFGPSSDAPWEVVGTRDTVITLDTPEYGSTVTFPIRVGGTITGVDENVHVQVRQQSSPEPIIDTCCAPAGGERARWQMTIGFTGVTDPALTVVAWSGGHVQDVEIFAITAVRPG